MVSLYNVHCCGLAFPIDSYNVARVIRFNILIKTRDDLQGCGKTQQPLAISRMLTDLLIHSCLGVTGQEKAEVYCKASDKTWPRS